MTTAAQKKQPNPAETAEKLGLTVESVFVPFSASRSTYGKTVPYNLKDYNINWKITLRRNGREILTTDYSAGQAHCPSYNMFEAKTKKDPYLTNIAIISECESGFASKKSWSEDIEPDRKKKIEPKSLNVIWSLLLDSDVLQHDNFEDWASSLGYDTDSRKAESIYQECLKIALKFCNAFTAAELEELREAFSEY